MAEKTTVPTNRPFFVPQKEIDFIKLGLIVFKTIKKNSNIKKIK